MSRYNYVIETGDNEYIDLTQEDGVRFNDQPTLYETKSEAEEEVVCLKNEQQLP